MTKKPCTVCNNMALEATILRNSGLCGTCVRDAKILAGAYERGTFEQTLEQLSGQASRYSSSASRDALRSAAIARANPNKKSDLARGPRSIGYWELAFVDDYPEELIGEVSWPSGSSLSDLLSTVPLPSDWLPPVVKWTAPSRDIPPLPPLNAGFQIVHESLLSIPGITGPHLEVRPLTIEAGDQQFDNYTILHLLESAPIWDLNASIWRPLSGSNQPMFMEHMVALNPLPAPAEIFRNEQFAPMVIVSDSLGQALLQQTSGLLRLRPLDNWHN